MNHHTKMGLTIFVMVSLFLIALIFELFFHRGKRFLAVLICSTMALVMILTINYAVGRDDGRYAASTLLPANIANGVSPIGGLVRFRGKTENLWQRPTIVIPVENGTFWYSVLFGKIIEIPFNSIEEYLNRSAFIPDLNLRRYPSAISRAIVPAVVFSIKRQPQTPTHSHVSVEISKHMPAFADVDTASAVTFPSWIVWIGASTYHSKPNGNDWMAIFAAQSKQSSSDEFSSAPVLHVRDDTGQYANSPLRSWFDSLRSGKGPCCSDADGSVVQDADWETKDGRYRVKLDGVWYDVPEDAVLTQPNLYGKTMVWPVFYRTMGRLDRVEIRCFIPGMMS